MTLLWVRVASFGRLCGALLVERGRTRDSVRAAGFDAAALDMAPYTVASLLPAVFSR